MEEFKLVVWISGDVIIRACHVLLLVNSSHVFKKSINYSKLY